MHGSQRLQDWINGGETRQLAGHRVEVHDRVVDEYLAFRRRVDDGLSRTRTP